MNVVELSDDPHMTEPRQNEYGRADKAAVWMLLSRLYLNAEVYIQTPKYDECMKYARNVISAGYDLCPNYAELFMADNGENTDARKEMIFTINFDGRWTQSKKSHSHFHPYMRAVCLHVSGWSIYRKASHK